MVLRTIDNENQIKMIEVLRHQDKILLSVLKKKKELWSHDKTLRTLEQLIYMGVANISRNSKKQVSLSKNVKINGYDKFGDLEVEIND